MKDDDGEERCGDGEEDDGEGSDEMIVAVVTDG